MKIIKSFTDENGQEVLVQGAGTNYDAELNSLAIGEGTVAVGEDLFVFGRCNAGDTDKVEIVGSGSLEYELLYKPGDLVTEIVSTTWHRIYYGGANVTELEQAFKSMYNNATIYWNMHETFPDNTVAFLICERDQANWMSAGLYFRTSDNKWYDLVHLLMYNKNPLFNEPKQEITSVTILSDEFRGLTTDKYERIYQSFFEYTVTPKNIRTLDWDGNEYIANSLAIGKDSKSDTNGQLVFGRGNKLDNTKAEIVGNGVEDGTITYDLTDVESIKNIPIGTELHTDILATDWYKNATLIVVANTLEELNELETNTIILGFAELQGLDDIDIYLYCKYKNLDESKTHRYAYIFKRKDEEQIRVKFTTICDTNKRFWFDEPLSNGMLFNSLQSKYSGDEVIRTLDWEGNEVLAGELTSKKVNTKSVKWEDDNYSRLIDSQEASLMPKIVEVSSQSVNVLNPITLHRAEVYIPTISVISMLALSNKFLKLITDTEKILTIWDLLDRTETTITFRNVKTSFANRLVKETIIEINYTTDAPTASVMHKVADLQTGDILYYLATSLS